MKFTVVIPTMWRFALFPKFLEDLIDNIYIDQVIIINNDNTRTPVLPTSEKITLIDKGKNLKVNPSWNLAVRMSRNEDICIINDDIIYDLRIFKYLSKSDQNQFGAAGLVYDGGRLDSEIEKGIINLQLMDFYLGWYGFGQLMYVKKSQWINIPHELLFGYGDDWIIHSNIQRSLLVYNIYGCLSITKASTTMVIVLDPKKVQQQEREYFQEYLNLLIISNYDHASQIKNNLKNQMKTEYGTILGKLTDSKSIAIYGENISEISKAIISTDKKVRIYNTKLDSDLQKIILQLIKFNDLQYEVMDYSDLCIDSADTIIIENGKDLNSISKLANKNIIILNEDANNSSLIMNNQWDIAYNINGIVVLAKKESELKYG